MNRDRIIRGYFAGKVVWITGASSGIGKAMAVACAHAGARLIISARRPMELEELARTLRNAEKQTDVSVLTLDVTEHKLIGKKVEQAAAIYGRIDILINNAGISQRSLVRDLTYEAAQAIIQTDLLGVIDLTLAVLKFMYRDRCGHIAVTSSVMGKMSTPYRSVYCAAKSGLHGFFSSLAAEGKNDNISVTIIVPGRVHTDISVNALTGGGQRQGIMDSGIAGGMSAEKAARLALAAIARRKFEYYFALTPLLRAGLFLNRFVPFLYRKLISKIKVT
ncbi:MAG: SDR family NAD(P)-dependent oxidoreductase [Spirochaetales bacterium]|nr:SDR family NAD(P)-dependent oxidoreductase [Spirochaetales bacterium]